MKNLIINAIQHLEINQISALNNQYISKQNKTHKEFF